MLSGAFTIKPAVIPVLDLGVTLIPTNFAVTVEKAAPAVMPTVVFCAVSD